MKQEPDQSCVATSDEEGVPYNIRLQRIRLASGKSARDVAYEVGVGMLDYNEWENCEAELNRVISISDVVKLSRVLAVPATMFFSNREHGTAISPEDLRRTITKYLQESGIAISEFEDQVGFAIAPMLQDSCEILNWNVDCLRFVCKAIGVDWLAALPAGNQQHGKCYP